ncbi:hypothetical protein J0677_25315, partial [Vibrio parahaemolyticus]|uniref:hypothetical protein n=1 Tax=Vibrio parahaemolyticus TaxID=670 RepID=UPI001A905635
HSQYLPWIEDWEQLPSSKDHLCDTFPPNNPKYVDNLSNAIRYSRQVWAQHQERAYPWQFQEEIQPLPELANFS